MWIDAQQHAGLSYCINEQEQESSFMMSVDILMDTLNLWSSSRVSINIRNAIAVLVLHHLSPSLSTLVLGQSHTWPWCTPPSLALLTELSVVPRNSMPEWDYWPSVWTLRGPSERLGRVPSQRVPHWDGCSFTLRDGMPGNAPAQERDIWIFDDRVGLLIISPFSGAGEQTEGEQECDAKMSVFGIEVSMTLGLLLICGHSSMQVENASLCLPCWMLPPSWKSPCKTELIVYTQTKWHSTFTFRRGIFSLLIRVCLQRWTVR